MNLGLFVDIAIVCLVLLAVVSCVRRGFTRVVASLAALVLAAGLALFGTNLNAAGMNTIVIPLTIPGTESGSMTFVYTLLFVAPRSYAASMRCESILDTVLYIGSIMKGRKS